MHLFFHRHLHHAIHIPPKHKENFLTNRNLVKKLSQLIAHQPGNLLKSNGDTNYLYTWPYPTSKATEFFSVQATPLVALPPSSQFLGSLARAPETSRSTSGWGHFVYISDHLGLWITSPILKDSILTLLLALSSLKAIEKTSQTPRRPMKTEVDLHWKPRLQLHPIRKPRSRGCIHSQAYVISICLYGTYSISLRRIVFCILCILQTFPYHNNINNIHIRTILNIQYSVCV